MSTHLLEKNQVKVHTLAKTADKLLFLMTQTMFYHHVLSVLKQRSKNKLCLAILF